MKECEKKELAKFFGQAFKEGPKPLKNIEKWRASSPRNFPKLRASSTDFPEAHASSASSSEPPVTVAELWRRTKHQDSKVKVTHPINSKAAKPKSTNVDRGLPQEVFDLIYRSTGHKF